MSPSKPVICQLLHGLEVGGAEVLAARLARQLAGDYRFFFICLDTLGTLGRQLQAEGFRVHVVGRQPGVDGRCVQRLAQLLRRERAQLIHAHQYTPFFYAMAARLLARRPAVLFEEHGRWHPDYPRPRRILFNRLLLERRDRVVGVGESVRCALIDNEGLPPQRVGVIYNGIDLAPYAQNGYDRRASVRREIGVGPDDLVLLQVARLDALKDHATALRTLDLVRRRRDDVRLVLVGEGPELAKIQALAGELDLGPHLRVLGLRRDVARLLAVADLFLLTSVSEGIPLTVIEAMAAGLPVVSTRVGGVPEIVEDQESGLLAPASDAAALAECVLRLADDPALRRSMGQRGRDRAWQVFSEERMHAAYRRLYEEMLSNG